MAELTDVELDDDGTLMATAILADGREVAVGFELDDDYDRDDDDDDDADDDADDAGSDTDAPSLEEQQQVVEHAIDRLTEEVLDRVERDVVIELTEAAYEEDETRPTQQDADSLARDMQLDTIIVFEDGTLLLFYTAEEQYPDSTISVQLGEDLEVEDLMVELDD